MTAQQWADAYGGREWVVYDVRRERNGRMEYLHQHGDTFAWLPRYGERVQ